MWAAILAVEDSSPNNATKVLLENLVATIYGNTIVYPVSVAMGGNTYVMQVSNVSPTFSGDAYMVAKKNMHAHNMICSKVIIITIG